jgi:ABC-type uncharacterized transport system ATPase subunit
VTSPGRERDDVALTLRNITKRYGPTVAVDDVSLECRWRRVHALLGENGAGKTTLMRIAFGLALPDSGEVIAAGRRVSTPAEALAAGIGMVHQHFTNVPAMTVAENVALGARGRYDARRAEERVDEIGKRTGLVLDPRARVERLPVGAQQRLEIVKALARNARLLILDEPTAVLAPAETEELLRWIRTFADEGNSVVLITHKLREALAIADDVTVLRRGRVALRTPAPAASIASLSTALLGEEPREDPMRRIPQERGAVVATLDRVTVVDDRGATRLRDASLELRAGDLVGVAAVEGAGQRELLRVLAARQTPTSGSTRLPSAVAFVPEDRHRDALVLDFDVAENVALAGIGARRGRIHWNAERARAQQVVSQYDVRGGDATTAVRSLSGGNQQKLVLARELDGRPALVVAENPTRGLDIRATRDVHERLRDAAANGAAVVMYSGDLDEVLALATRVVVVHATRVQEHPLDRDIVGRAMVGGE